MPCINLYANAAGTNDAPIVIQNCTIRQAANAVVFEGRYRSNRDRPMPCGHVVFRNNTLFRCHEAVVLTGAVHHVLIAGNRILDSGNGAIGLPDLLPGATDVLVVNNTMLRFQAAVQIWDDHARKDFLKCRNVRCQNNLVLGPANAIQLAIWNHPRSNWKTEPFKPGDMKSLLESPGWHFSHNWREHIPPKPGDPFLAGWIPAGPEDHLEVPIEVLSRKPSDADFLRPPKDSPLATGGAGVSDIPLPAYVGAVPPEGVEPWDWQKTWNAMAR
jgi:hypothetical protein